MNLLEKAIVIATQAHAGTVDKGGKPYIFHPLRVMMKLDDEIDRVIAVLHDTVEDTSVTFDYLREEGFPEEVISGLDAVTRREGELYTEFILRAKQHPIGRKVKLADLDDNMDLTRIPNPTKKDYNRLEKYKKAKKILLDDCKIKIWTYFYNAFTMGGQCNQPTGFEKEVENEVDLGGGYKGYEILTPKGKTIIVEKSSGAIVGSSLTDVRNDIETADPKIMAKQVEQACKELKNVKIISEEKFWQTYEK